MKIQFLDVAADTSARLVARFVNQDAVPADIEPVLAGGAKRARFSGKAGQLFEGFVDRGGNVVRVALAGIGEASAKDRKAAVERAGAGVVAKYLTSGETALTLDVTGAGLTAEEAAGALLGAVLRAWRHDVYRTKLKDDARPSLTDLTIVCAPEGTEAAWAVEQAIAEGVSFTRELVTEPANIIYPESFVERCQARGAGSASGARPRLRRLAP